VLLCAAPSSAATRRFAVVAGHNRGADGEAVLRFAEADAEKLALVFTELGGVAGADLTLLRGPSAQDLRAALTNVAGRVRDLHAAPGERAIVIFYYSGHSDGEALELGNDRLMFSELRSMLSATGADVRVVLLDSCRSGALLALKGGQPGPGFQIRLSDEIASTGEAMISSSASDEMALESREIRGSFFTHHLVSGLRGAADTSGDGRVTLAEAYDYVFKHTVSATSATTIGPQHPGYTYRLSGEGDLVLTDLSVRTAMLSVPSGFDRALILDKRAERVLAEVGPAGAASLALPSGDYLVRATIGQTVKAAAFHLRDGERRTLSPAELSPLALDPVTWKGGRPAPEALWTLEAGAARGVSYGARLQPALRLSRASGTLGFAAQVSSAAGPGFRETSLLGSGVYAVFAFERERFTLQLGPEAGGGAVWQARHDASSAWSLAAIAGAQASCSMRAGPLVLSASVHAAAEVLRRDGALAVTALPSAFIGLSFWK
jgi:hypothetical protein